jgi:capsular polysaccharide biosynthesis protein
MAGIEQASGTRVEAGEDEHGLSLGELLRVVRERLWVIALVTSVLTGATVGLSLAQAPIYEASIKILVGQEQGSTSEGLGGEVQGLQQLTQTMAEGVKSRPVAKAVIGRYDLRIAPEDLLEDHLNVVQIGTTQFIQVDYRDPNPERAQQVANAIGEAFSDQVSDISPSANAVTATVWEPAELPDEPVSPNLALNIGLALVVGLMLGMGLAFLLEYLDDSWRSPEEAERIAGVPTFGVIPAFEVSKGKKGS